jgi:hypothetical protein
LNKKLHIVFLTTSSLAANPRLVKEVELLKKEFTCYVLSFKHHDWSLELSEAIKSRNPEVHFIEIDRKMVALQTILCKIIHKSAILFNNHFSKSFKICAFSSNDKAAQLYFNTSSLPKHIKISRVIAHNIGAFYAAVNYSEKKAAALQLDIEDYYPGEASYFNKKLETQNRLHLMEVSFSKSDAITYASLGIQLECEKHFKVKGETKQEMILNSFNDLDFTEPKANSSEKIKCVWYSQYIGPNRGLEQIFEAARSLGKVEFHIVGSQNQDFLGSVTLSENIIIHDIMQQSELHAFLATMDIGLALEPGKDLNNTIALSNKIITYAQAGLYVLATDTVGQSQFLKSLDYNAGFIIQSSLIDILLQFDTTLLAVSTKIDRWKCAKLFSWDNEKLKINKLLS